MNNWHRIATGLVLLSVVWARSDPLDSWAVRIPGVAGSTLGIVKRENGRFITVGSGGGLLTSIDGIAWVSEQSGTDRWLDNITYGNGIFVIVGEDGTILTSPDFASWTAQSPVTASELNSIIYTNNQFVAVGQTGTILTSPDGF